MELGASPGTGPRKQPKPRQGRRIEGRRSSASSDDAETWLGGSERGSQSSRGSPRARGAGLRALAQALHAELEALIAAAQQLDGEHETARGLARELTRRKREAQLEGDKLRSRLAAHLRGTFGFTSEQLIQFGLEPLKRGARRRRAGTPPQGGTQPPATPAPTPVPAPAAPAPSPQAPA